MARGRGSTSLERGGPGGGGPPPRILHLFANFDEHPGPLRAVRIINALVNDAAHAIVSGDPERRGAARGLAKAARVSWPAFPALAGSKSPGRLLNLAGAMGGYDLVCTHGYGALDAALAHTLFADVHKLAPLVHHEFSLEPEEAAHARRRGWYRRFALGRAAALVVGDQALEALALDRWDQPRTRVRLIPHGIETRAYAAAPQRDLLPGLIKRRGEMWIAAFTGASSSPDLAPLVRTLATLAAEWQLVIVGDARQARFMLEAEAERLEIEDRVHFAGDVAARGRLFALVDIAALPEGLAEAPTIALEAMAAACPIIAPRRGEVPALLASDNGQWLAQPGVEDDLASKLRLLAADPAERKRVGRANRDKARAEFDQSRMIERTRALYFGLMGMRQGAARDDRADAEKA